MIIIAKISPRYQKKKEQLEISGNPIISQDMAQKLIGSQKNMAMKKKI